MSLIESKLCPAGHFLCPFGMFGDVNIGRETEFIEFEKSTFETKEEIISIASMLNKHNKGTCMLNK